MPEIRTRKLDITLNGKLIKKDFEVPEDWSDTAATIAATKYATDEENSALEIIYRVANQIGEWGWAARYFDNNPEKHFDKSCNKFTEDLTQLMIDQKIVFNSPIYFNLGVDNQSDQSSACFVGNIEDDMEDILEHTKRAGMIFKSGSGIGINVSKLRAEGESLSNKGTASGPISFMKMWDRCASVVKSGGKTRRAAVLVAMDIDHPDIEEFIHCKSNEEDKAKILIDAGIPAEEAYATVDFQNANHSVVVTDEFMQIVRHEGNWNLINRGNGGVSKTLKARDLFNQIAEQAWKTGDPGLQFRDTINKQNPLKVTGTIENSNPCFTGDMHLLTSKGYKTFKELEEQEFEIISPVNLYAYKGKVWKSGIKQTIKLKFNWKTNLPAITCTPDHVFKTIDGQDIEADNLKGKQIKPIINQAPIYNTDLSLAGFIQGDGNTGRLICKDHIGLEVYIGQKDHDLIDIFNINPQKIANDGKGTWYSRRAYNIAINYKLSSANLSERELPSDLINHCYSDLMAKEFLSGLYSANGSVISKTRIAFKTTCKNLALQLKAVLKLYFNIEAYITTNKPSKIKWHNGEYTSRESYDINIHQWNSIKIFLEEINFLQEYKRKALLETYLARTPKVTKIVDNGFQDVYDFSEPEFNWGIIEGFQAHNCGEVYLPKWGCCQLCAFNLPKYLNDNNKLEIDMLEKDTEVVTTAMDIIIGCADYPTEEFKKEAIETRPLGIGATDLAGYLIRKGLAYNSEEGRIEANKIIRDITEAVLTASIKLAKKVGPFPRFEEEKESTLLHYQNIVNSWSNFMPAIELHGIRNCTATALAPNGSSGLLVDSDGLGIEPIFALQTTKTLVGGGTLEFIPDCINEALDHLQAEGYKGGMTAEKAIANLPEDKQAIFLTANEISWQDHIRMVASLQQATSQGISKTINLPNSATVEDIKEAYMMAWELGCKGITVYRDGSKELQPLRDSSKKKAKTIDKIVEVSKPVRKKLPVDRKADCHKIDIAGFEGYLHTGLYEDGSLGEIFIRASKQGSFQLGMLDSFATMVSVGLQYGVPLEDLVNKFKGQNFEPQGITQNPDIRFCKSVIDYIFKYLEQKFLVKEFKAEEPELNKSYDGPLCSNCGGFMTPAGSCFYCNSCGSSSGGCS